MKKFLGFLLGAALGLATVTYAQIIPSGGSVSLYVTQTWTAAQTIHAHTAFGSLATIDTEPIFGAAPRDIVQVIADTLTNPYSTTSHGIAASFNVVPANAAGVYVGQGILLNAPDTNLVGIGQLLGQEIFLYHDSPQSSGASSGGYIGVLWFDGAATQLSGQVIEVSNNGNDTITTMRGLYVGVAGYAGTVTNMESIRISTPGSGGTITNARGLYIQDFTGVGSTISRAIDVNDNFIVGPDGSTLSVSNYIDIAPAGVRAAGADGVLTLLGLGNGNDENLTIDFDNAAANEINIASGTGVSVLDFTDLTIEAAYNAADGTAGLTQTCAAAVTAVTVKNGLITAITCP